MTQDARHVVIVGAGHAGAQCAVSLRQLGFTGRISLIGREAELPYERPPLSKEYLAKEKPFERLLIRPDHFWTEKAIELHLGTSVDLVDASTKLLTLSDGTTCGYDYLVWATGGDPRRLACPGSDLDGIHVVRTRQDCDGLMSQLDRGAKQIVVIGGGYIGLEAAAVLTKLGCEVTLLEALPRVLARVAGPQLSTFYEAEHRRHGVDLKTGTSVARLLGESSVSGVELEDGSVLAADAVIVGIGIVPAVGPLLAAGALGEGCVIVDDHCRTSLPDVFAIGDCAIFACRFAGGAMMRVESVQNANDQATCAAKAICGLGEPYAALPWFWSNQYDLRLQTVGISAGYDNTVLRGNLETRSFSVVYLKEGRVIALDCVNMVKDYAQGRKLIEAGAHPDLARLADTSIPLKDLLV